MMKKLRPVLLLVCSIICLLCIARLSYAWYVNTQVTQTEDAELVSNGIMLSYTIDDDTTVNASTYEIHNLVFFDLDNEHEGKYFTKMAILMELNIENKSKRAVDITVSQGTVAGDNPYVACAVVAATSDDTEDDKLNSDDAEGSVLDFLGTDLMKSATIEDVEEADEAGENGGTVKFFVYIYGIQPDDDADNTFLGNYQNKAKYNFRLVISAVEAAE